MMWGINMDGEHGKLTLPLIQVEWLIYIYFIK